MSIFELPEYPVILQMCLAAVCIYAYIVIITRIFGKRTFAKMSSFDFAVTIAMGSILADAVNKPLDNLVPAFISIVLLAALQVIFAKIRTASQKAAKISSNTPQFLMRNGEILHHNLKMALMTEMELMAKLREANVLELSEVRAVILETTGDISVLHGEKTVPTHSPILKGVTAQ